MYLSNVMPKVAGGITTVIGVLISIEFWGLIRASSHTYGRWYLPMFLLKDGLLTCPGEPRVSLTTGAV